MAKIVNTNWQTRNDFLRQQGQNSNRSLPDNREMKRFFILSLVLVPTLCTSCLTDLHASSIVETSKKAKKEKTIIAKANQTKAEEDNNNIDLLASGIGKNADEAISMALKNAIEQAFGAFVSANTLILNDELVQDQIATVSSGNINSYEVLSTNTLPDGLVSVNLRTSISLSNLISYAESHGSSVELAGQTFVRNIKLKELNQKNEAVALMNLFEQLYLLQIYDYKLTANPTVHGDDYNLQLTIQFIRNSNFQAAIDLISSSLASISISEEEADSWRKDGFTPSYIRFALKDIENQRKYYFRNEASGLAISQALHSFFYSSMFAWLIRFDNSQHSIYSSQDLQGFRYVSDSYDIEAIYYGVFDDRVMSCDIGIGIYFMNNLLCVIEEQREPLILEGNVPVSETELKDIKNIEVLPDANAIQKALQQDMNEMKKFIIAIYNGYAAEGWTDIVKGATF